MEKEEIEKNIKYAYLRIKDIKDKLKQKQNELYELEKQINIDIVIRYFRTIKQITTLEKEKEQEKIAIKEFKKLEEK